MSKTLHPVERNTMKRITATAIAVFIILAPAPALADTTPDYCPDPPSACATITPPGSAEPFPGDTPVDDAQHMTGSAEPFPGDAPVITSDAPAPEVSPEAPAPVTTPEAPAPEVTPEVPNPIKVPRPGLPKAGV